MGDIRAFFERRRDAWSQRDAAALSAGYADEAVITSPMFPRVEGRTAIEKSFEALFRIFPDWEMTCEAACIDGNRAMQACRVRATQVGEFMGIAGAGKRVEFDCVLVMEFDGDRITKERRIYDFTGLLIQLGVLRGKPAI